ncbi:type II toxin-antitoxin system HipA family toxin [Falsiroseomonas sp. E2-1-a20]|uniref:type II toxin-antitoxin system HipA family toxin n=1 Tax=Falsiroseomonas sp. E2-1-a20 TaxID=3239300 RepID=UPI003F3AA1A5
MAWPTSERIEKLVVFGPDANGEVHPAGLLTFEGQDMRQSRFRYARTWVENGATRRDLFPTGLRMISKSTVSTPHNVPLPFYDAGPDGWGKAVMDRAYPDRKMDMAEYLALAGDERSGELSFGPDESGPSRWLPDKPLVELTDGEQDLEALAEAAERFEEGQPADRHVMLLLRDSAAIGGARPKGTFRSEGCSWLVKLPAYGDRFNDPRIEMVCLELAERCGIEVPRRRLVEAGRFTMLLVERFDRQGAKRLGYMSAGTLMGVAPWAYNQTQVTYADIAAKGRGAGIRPPASELFRRMLYNRAINNADDHLRNHGFIRVDGKWRLSPAFDMVPSPLLRSTLAPAKGVSPALDGSLPVLCCSAFGLTMDEGRAISEEVEAGLAGMRELLDEHRASDQDRAVLAQNYGLRWAEAARPRG